MQKYMQTIWLFSFSLIAINTIYNYTLPGTYGANDIHLSSFKGKKILIVNTATNSIYVSQYATLEQLYQLYKDSLVVIAVPSNSFNDEEMSDTTIAAFVNNNFHITYFLAAKTEVIGDNQNPLYHWLTDKTANGVVSNSVSGDFQKFLIDPTGKIIGIFAPEVDPMNDELQQAIKNTNN